MQRAVACRGDGVLFLCACRHGRRSTHGNDYSIQVTSTNVRRAVAQLHTGHCGIMVPMGYLVETSLERDFAGGSGFENSWGVVQGLLHPAVDEGVNIKSLLQNVEVEVARGSSFALGSREISSIKTVVPKPGNSVDFPFYGSYILRGLRCRMIVCRHLQL